MLVLPLDHILDHNQTLSRLLYSIHLTLIRPPHLLELILLVVSSPTQVGSDSNSSRFDSLMLKAVGATLCPKIVPDDSLDDWVKWWQVISHHKGRLYHVPGGSIGCIYVDLLTIEMSHLAVGNYSSERLMTFSAVILQHSRLVRKGCDIRRVLERRMTMWINDEFDHLIEEAVKCDNLFGLSTQDLIMIILFRYPPV